MQRSYNGHFDDLHFSECRLGRPDVFGGTLTIPVKGVLPLAGHPLARDAIQPLSGSLVFRGVTMSSRNLLEYIGDPRQPAGFRDEYVVEDMPLMLADNVGLRRYALEGVFEAPLAWVDWEISARSFELLLDDSPNGFAAQT